MGEVLQLWQSDDLFYWRRKTGGGKVAQREGLLRYAYIYAPSDEHADELVPKVAEWCRKFKEKSETPILDCYYRSNVRPHFELVDVWLGQDPRTS